MPWSTLPAHPTSSSSLFSPFSSSSSFCQLSFLNVTLSLTFRLSGNKTWFWTVQIFILLNRRKLATASRNGAVHQVGRNVVRRCALKLTGIGTGWPRQRWSKFFFVLRCQPTLSSLSGGLLRSENRFAAVVCLWQTKNFWRICGFIVGGRLVFWWKENGISACVRACVCVCHPQPAVLGACSDRPTEKKKQQKKTLLVRGVSCGVSPAACWGARLLCHQDSAARHRRGERRPWPCVWKKEHRVCV